MARLPDQEPKHKSQDRETKQYMNSAYTGVKNFMWGIFYILQYVLWVVLEVIKLAFTAVAQVAGGVATLFNAVAGVFTKISGATDDTQRDINQALKNWKAREDEVARQADKIRAGMAA